ncbi:Na+/H+ antiporter subunit C [Roseomonas sp. JC162]|uniref:Na+/H+ antiporter subunit C n=1 Tax=Neoroseomonas marina TaxID=1232220 RepID=A0A848E947_9PROT|nr:Na+/H+ antiporter subunit C [Neoroseomonas marina]NMJ40606.1 Na+/H+ antiporter subunit C [Neoroseomonas marina]
MEIVVSLAIGVLTGSGVWLLLRPRTFQVIVGLALLSYAVNLFIFSTGGLRSGAAAVLSPGEAGTLGLYVDPLPQALVLTAIVIGFATTALLLVVLLAARGLTGTDHVDGRERER